MTETDMIGGFPKADPNCAGCGTPLVIENAWMTDGCPCNCALGINSQNETRWRLLMQLQQSQQYQAEWVKRGLERSVTLQSHYASLLNTIDGGKRMQFANADAWLKRLQEVDRET